MARLLGYRTSLCAAGAVAVGALLGGTARAAAPTVEQALKLLPVQKNVEIDTPAPADVAGCTIKAENGGKDWVVRDASENLLRRFSDTNGDKIVDLWCYFSHGIEVYRDIDSDFNGKADQSRWLNTAGTRWGLDANEDGVFDGWKQIAAEEVSAEVVAALCERDEVRFRRLLASPQELAAFGLETDKAEQLAERLKAAPQGFTELVRDNKAFGPGTRWLQFGASRPGVVAAGTFGAAKDLTVYENAVAITDTDGQSGQVQLGTLVQIDGAWRLVEAPRFPADDDGATDAGLFFTSPVVRNDATGPATGSSAAVQKLLAELDQLDKSEANVTQDQLQAFQARRADVLEKLAAEATAEDRPQWIKQFADTVSAAVQNGAYPDGANRLRELADALAKDAAQHELAGYVQFRCLTAAYGLALQDPSASFDKVQSAWLEGLKKFAADFPDGADAPEALLQLGIAEEFAGNDEQAVAWYQKIVQGFPVAPSAKKAQGAITRLGSVGKSIALRGPAINANNQLVDLARFRGKTVVVHFWSSTSEPCKTDLAQLKELFAKYGKSGFALVGVSLDENRDQLLDYLAENKLLWPQIFEPGGLDSRLACELGILTLPTMMLIDDKGLVVNRSVHISEIETELKKRLQLPPGTASRSAPQDPRRR